MPVIIRLTNLKDKYIFFMLFENMIICTHHHLIVNVVVK